MNMLNKTVGFILNPLFLGMSIIAIGMVLAICRRRKMTIWCMMAAVAWFWFWSMPITGSWLAMPLEKDFPVQLAEDMPTADAIALMGGGVGGSTNYPYAMLRDGADRAWHAARLWRAGKAPIIIPSNVGAELADIRLLTDLGVPKDAVVLETKAENTEENAKFVRDILLGSGGVVEFNSPTHLFIHSPTSKPKVLLVTSACHMKRSLYMFRKYAPEIECIPAATDYQALPWKDEPFKWRHILPDIGAFAHNNSFIHEYIGYYGYKWFR